MSELVRRIKNYELSYMQDYGFEQIMVHARQRCIVELIKQTKPEVVIEIGCGNDQLFSLLTECDFIRKWVIIEPADAFVKHASETFKGDSRVQVVQGFVENVEPSEVSLCDLCIVSGMLHEVQKPLDILLAARKLVKSGGMIHANVPNALSMHRQLAVNMGLIPSVYEVSDRNKSLSQYHLFDMQSLETLIVQTGLSVEAKGGYLVKPFTHKQMEALSGVVGDAVLDGLWLLGKQYPELASEIYINATLGEGVEEKS